jgi:hypothetical protein
MNTGLVSKKYYRFKIIIAGLTLFALSCISPFEPDYRGKANSLVVDGSLIKGYDKQVINISRSSSILLPRYEQATFKPEENCNVKIIDDSGNEFLFTEESQGKYTANIDDALLNYGTKYRLEFTTSSGETYESGYQTLLKTAPVDNIYCIKETHYSPEFDKENIEVLQFYVDLNAPADASKYYRWQIEETWEIHASYEINGFWDGSNIKLFDSSSDSLYYCWNTKTMTGVYTASTVGLSQNVIKKIPLHFKESTSKALIFKYCATVKQFALNQDAYDYWHTKEKEITESGDIYTNQPYQVKSNIYNTNNPDENVLGYFWVSSCTLRRLFVEKPFNNSIGSDNQCNRATTCTWIFNEDNLDFLYAFVRTARQFPKPPPVFFYIEIVESVGICFNFSKDECVDCRIRGGTIQRPDFWE